MLQYVSNISNGQSSVVIKWNEGGYVWIQTEVAEACEEKIQSITQHQVKRLPLSVINLVSSKCGWKGAGYGYLQCNPQSLTQKKKEKLRRSWKAKCQWAGAFPYCQDSFMKGIWWLVIQPACRIPGTVGNIKAEEQFMRLEVSLTLQILMRRAFTFF